MVGICGVVGYEVGGLSRSQPQQADVILIMLQRRRFGMNRRFELTGACEEIIKILHDLLTTHLFINAS